MTPACLDRWPLFDAAADALADHHPDAPVVAEAKAVCRQCERRVQCLTDALGRRDAHGVRGGLDAAERAELATKRGFLSPSLRGDRHDRSAYTGGCRCDRCRAANRSYIRTWRATRTPVTRRLTVVVNELAVPVGRGRYVAGVGQTYLEVAG